MHTSGFLADTHKAIAEGNYTYRTGITNATGLHRAVDDKFYEPGVVTAWVKAGLDPNAKDANQRTPLYWARHPQAIAELIANGANPNAKDVNGDTPLHTNLSREKPSAQWNRVKALLDGGSDIDTKNNRGATPLMVALEARRDEDLIRDILDRGADVKATDRTGQSVLMWATAENTPDQVQLLIERGAHIDHRDHDGMTALNHCVHSAQTDMAGLLLQHGADPNRGNNQGRTPLHTLAQHDPLQSTHRGLGLYSSGAQQKMATALLEAGANPIKRDIEGNTPLHIAANRGHAALATTLIEHGADPRLTNHQGKSALDLAKDQATHDVIAPAATHLSLQAALAMEQSQSRARSGRRM